MRLLSLVIAGTLLASLAVSTADGQEGPDYSREGADTCLSCHEDEGMLAIFRWFRRCGRGAAGTCGEWHRYRWFHSSTGGYVWYYRS